jgi:lysophospholipase L1-like esterase
MVVLGHSGATGFGSDPTNFGRDAYENSWATGTNSQVNSVYLRFLVHNPKLRGHNYNFAKDGSRVDDLARQATLALQLRPLPDLVLIQTIDNDIRCDGTDVQNYEVFRATLQTALEQLHVGAPSATIFLVSQWGSVQRSVEVGQQLPFSVKYASGDGPCDVYDPSGAIRPQKVQFLQDVVDHYHAQLRAACATVPNCRTDNGAMQRLDLVLDDVVADGNHLSVQGHHKMASIAWDALH